MADVDIERSDAHSMNVADSKAPGPSEASPAQPQWSLKRLLGLGACCALPLLAGVILAGGGGALLGAAGAVLPFLAALACPLGMYFMMRSMSKMGQENPPQTRGKSDETPPEL